MIGIDTNILVRYFADDDVAHSPVAMRFLESLTSSKRGYVSVAALLELSWVLGRCYKIGREGLVRTLQHLLTASHLEVERCAEVADAVERFRQGSADLPDYLIERRCSNAGCSCTMTFDARAAKSAGMQLVSLPADAS
ncbi:type II toxin-antitoxin system VapC family toxin [Mitsuaria sp. GD03876]|uniref:PIN domain-containing protein n=1 Tax=Mitsuaria sp. GD03876 TaxID=2975399 RepID=UPI002447C327|nr:type II toxin-antitoxin system VapC family toxin [Mitsuaria sp. GD03876]MDH0863770.1 type II toxin-antitoxin system VapC family toxin [Mitsuaria sp. GD03876]